MALLLCIAGMGQNTTTLIFTGKDQHGQWVQLNNITVENITNQWQVPLVYPDTVLILNNLVGINDNNGQNATVILTVHPNPFNGTTEAELLLKEGGSAHFKISDMNGREVTALTTPFLTAGNHHFRITLTTPQTYILNVTQNGNSASVKLVNASDGGRNAISYYGTTSTSKKPMLFSANPFSSGNLMRYMGFVQRNGSTFSDVITQYQSGDDIILFSFTLPDLIPSLLCHDTLIKQMDAICNGAIYNWHGKLLTTSGIYYDSLKTADGGCDSVFQLMLSLLPNSTSSESAYICPGKSHFWHGKTFSTPGVYRDTIPSANGCDSVCTLTLSLMQNSTFTEAIAICPGTTHIWHGKTFSPPGVYRDTIPSTNGCDSVCTLILSILQNSTSTETITICPGKSHIWHGKTFSTPGVYRDTLPSANGCDSVCTLIVNIGLTYFFSQKDSINSGSTLSWHGKILGAAGIYYDSLKTVNGCDSIYQLELSIITPSLTFICGTSVVQDVDGNTYHTLQIGTQCWMKENLKTSKFPDGTTIPTSSSSSTVLPYLYVPNKDNQNIPDYGYMYNWTAAMNSSSAGDYTVQGACPDGWHLPSITEWKTLINYMKGVTTYKCNNSSTYIAKAAASQIGWTTATQTCAIGNNPSQNNLSGFSAMPAGLVRGTHTNYFGTDCKMWSTEESPSDDSEASTAYLQNTSATFNTVTGIWGKDNGFTVRCIYGKGGHIGVTTANVSNIGSTTAQCGGNVTIDGGTAITARGVCWSTSPNPTISNSKTTNGNGLGSFTSTLTNLTPQIPYYVRAYATNSFGTAYGEEKALVIPNSNDGTTCTGTPTVTDKNGNVYNTVQIGKQCWMRENLRATSYSDGRAITYGNSNTSTTTAYYYYPYGSNTNIQTYGLLYNVAAVFDGAGSSTANPSGVQGICPTGWHVPSRAEWTELTDYAGANLNYQCNGSYKNYAKALCATSGWNNGYSACTPGVSPANNNASNFSATPCGYFDGSAYSTAGQHARFWTTYKSSSYGYYVQFSYYGPGTYQLSGKYYEGCAVRCVKN